MGWVAASLEVAGGGLSEWVFGQRSRERGGVVYSDTVAEEYWTNGSGWWEST